MVVRHIAGFVGAVLGLAAACVVIDPNANLCAIGQAECACTIGGACDPGLECRSGMCVDPDAPTTDDPSTSDDDSDTEPGTSSMTDPTIEPSTGDTGPQPSMPNFAFVTSATFTGGAVGGLDGADSKCQDAADEAGRPGTYRAWLSLPDNHARDRLGDASGWIRTDDRPFATDVPQIVDGRFFYPPVLDEHGVFTAGRVWTGTNIGMAEPAGSDFCGNWTSDDGASVGLTGDLGAGPGWWTAFDIWPCDMPAHLVCLGVDQQHELEVQPVEGRLAFVTADFLSPTAGRPAADTLCQQEASDAGYDGEFLSLLGVDGEAPATRFNTDGPPWVRHDGMPIFPDVDPFAVQLETPIAFDAMGDTSQLAIVWAGAPDVLVAGTNGSTCTNWTSATGYASMFNVIHIYWMGWALGGSPECAQPGYSVVCLEL